MLGEEKGKGGELLDSGCGDLLMTWLFVLFSGNRQVQEKGVIDYVNKTCLTT